MAPGTDMDALMSRTTRHILWCKPDQLLEKCFASRTAQANRIFYVETYQTFWQETEAVGLNPCSLRLSFFAIYFCSHLEDQPLKTVHKA